MTIERERIVGSSSPGFSVSRKMVANSGGSSRTFSSELEGRLGEDVDPFPGFARPVVNGPNHAPHLVHLDHQLRRIGRDHQHVRMGLNKQPGFFLVRLAQIFPGLDRLREAGVEIL
jgi:hypothetical protein